MSNYVQPDYRIPAAAGVSVQVELIRNVLQTVSPIPIVPYTQPDTMARSLTAAQLGGSKAGMLGTSKITHADGTVTNL